MRHPARSGFTWVDFAVVLVIVGFLTALLIPIQMKDRTVCSRAQCPSNQRQIVLSCLIYQNDNHGDWPVSTVDGHGVCLSQGTPGFDPTRTALASLEFISFTTGDDLPRTCFRCPQKVNARPTENASFRGIPGDTSPWAVAGPMAMGFCYDWSVPGNSPSTGSSSSRRVVTADRDISAHAGKNVWAVFADGHVKSIPTNDGQFLNPDAANDDIYTDVGDGPMNLPGQGSTTRAYVR